jgi:hypothetical protein
MTPFIWIAVALMLIGAVMLVADIGAPALWIAVITVGIALVAIDRIRARRGLSSQAKPSQGRPRGRGAGRQ